MFIGRDVNQQVVISVSGKRGNARNPVASIFTFQIIGDKLAPRNQLSSFRGIQDDTLPHQIDMIARLGEDFGEVSFLMMYDVDHLEP